MVNHIKHLSLFLGYKMNKTRLPAKLWLFRISSLSAEWCRITFNYPPTDMGLLGKHQELWAVLIFLIFFISNCVQIMPVDSKEYVLSSESLDLVYSTHGLLKFSLKISDYTFDNPRLLETDERNQGITIEQLKALKIVKHIRGNLTITAIHPEFKSLFFLRI